MDLSALCTRRLNKTIFVQRGDKISSHAHQEDNRFIPSKRQMRSLAASTGQEIVDGLTRMGTLSATLPPLSRGRRPTQSVRGAQLEDVVLPQFTGNFIADAGTLLHPVE